MQMSNAPVSPGGSASVFQDWIDALTKPNEGTFAALAASPRAQGMTAYMWIFIGFLVEFFLSSLVRGVGMRQMMQQYGFGSQAAPGIGGTLLGAVCGAPIGAVIFTLFFALDVIIVQWIAKMFGGKGTSGQLAYAWSCIGAPFSMIAGVVSLFSAIPLVGLCFSLLILLALIYVIVLNVMAVKGVNQFGWGPALGAVFIPGLVIGFVCGCLVIATLSVMGPIIGNVFSSINQSLGGTGY